MQTIDKAAILMDQVLFLLLVGELGDRWMMCKICFWQKCTENPNWYLKDKAALVVQVGFVCSGGGVMRTDAANKIRSRKRTRETGIGWKWKTPKSLV